VFAKREKGRHSREFIHTLGVVGKQRSLGDFGVNFLPVGTPGAFRAPLGDQVVSQSDFETVFRCPGDALWDPGGSFGRPGACLGTNLGVTWAPKVAKKERRKSCWCTLCVRVDLSAKRERPRGECG
jgi:hypothetical protein